MDRGLLRQSSETTCTSLTSDHANLALQNYSEFLKEASERVSNAIFKVLGLLVKVRFKKDHEDKALSQDRQGVDAVHVLVNCWIV